MVGAVIQRCTGGRAAHARYLKADTKGVTMDLVTPAQVDSRLRELGKELDYAYQQLGKAEKDYASCKSDYEINSARARKRIRDQALRSGSKVTVAEVEDDALLECADDYRALNTAEAVVRLARENNRRVNTHIDIARSVGTNVRAAMTL